MISRIFITFFILFCGLISLAILLGKQNHENTLIAYTQTDAQNISRVFILDIQTGVQADISSHIAPEHISARIPRWSLDGEHIVFWTYLNQQDAFIYETSLNGRFQDNLTERLGYASLPIYAPSGELGFASSPTNERASNGVPFYVLDSKTNSSHLLIENIVSEPQWSSDGHYLTYLSKSTLSTAESGGLNIYTLNTETGKIRNWTESILSAGIPSLSPDDKYIAFVPISVSIGRLHIINTETGDISNPSNLLLKSRPVWSPDGKFLAFVYQLSGNFEIGILNIETNEVRNISNHPAHDLQPGWSPDGKYIAFVSRRSGQDDLYLYDIASEQIQRLTASPESESNPVWRP